MTLLWPQTRLRVIVDDRALLVLGLPPADTALVAIVAQREEWSRLLWMTGPTLLLHSGNLHRPPASPRMATSIWTWPSPTTSSAWARPLAPSGVTDFIRDRIKSVTSGRYRTTWSSAHHQPLVTTTANGACGSAAKARLCRWGSGRWSGRGQVGNAGGVTLRRGVRAPVPWPTCPCSSMPAIDAGSQRSCRDRFRL